MRSPTSCSSTATPIHSVPARSKPSASSPANPHATSTPKIKVYARVEARDLEPGHPRRRGDREARRRHPHQDPHLGRPPPSRHPTRAQHGPPRRGRLPRPTTVDARPHHPARRPLHLPPLPGRRQVLRPRPLDPLRPGRTTRPNPSPTTSPPSADDTTAPKPAAAGDTSARPTATTPGTAPMTPRTSSHLTAHVGSEERACGRCDPMVQTLGHVRPRGRSCSVGTSHGAPASHAVGGRDGRRPRRPRSGGWDRAAVGFTERVRGGLGLAPDPFVPSAAEGEVRLERVRSQAMGDINLFTAVPAGHGDGAGLPVVVVLHGASASAAELRGFGLARFVSAAVAAGAPPFVLAGTDDGPAGWLPTDGVDPQLMLREELPRWLGERGYAADRRALWGWSRGGYGALRFVVGRPTTVSAVALSVPLSTRATRSCPTSTRWATCPGGCGVVSRTPSATGPSRLPTPRRCLRTRGSPAKAATPAPTGTNTPSTCSGGWHNSSEAPVTAARSRIGGSQRARTVSHHRRHPTSVMAWASP